MSALGYGVSGSPPSSWRWGLTSLAPLELGPAAWTAMISLHFTGFGWRAETGLLSFYYCTSTALIRQIPFLPLFFFFWGNCCWFFFYYIIYLFCLYKQAEDSAQQSVLSFDHVGLRD